MWTSAVITRWKCFVQCMVNPTFWRGMWFKTRRSAPKLTCTMQIALRPASCHQVWGGGGGRRQCGCCQTSALLLLVYISQLSTWPNVQAGHVGFSCVFSPTWGCRAFGVLRPVRAGPALDCYPQSSPSPITPFLDLCVCSSKLIVQAIGKRGSPWGRTGLLCLMFLCVWKLLESCIFMGRLSKG
jgi:hypothetical protein